MDSRQEIRAKILVLSDRCSRGEREDLSGPALVAWLAERGVAADDVTILPDDREAIVRFLRNGCDGGAWDLILTCGGTGVAPRDVTSDATRDILDYELPGFGEAMRRSSMEKSPHAIVSRAVAGVRRRALIINLPGSPRGAVENLEAVWAAVPHAVAKVGGDPSDCAG